MLGTGPPALVFLHSRKPHQLNRLNFRETTSDEDSGCPWLVCSLPPGISILYPTTFSMLCSVSRTSMISFSCTMALLPLYKCLLPAVAAVKIRPNASQPDFSYSIGLQTSPQPCEPIARPRRSWNVSSLPAEQEHLRVNVQSCLYLSWATSPRRLCYGNGSN